MGIAALLLNKIAEKASQSVGYTVGSLVLGVEQSAYGSFPQAFSLLVCYDHLAFFL